VGWTGRLWLGGEREVASGFRQMPMILLQTAAIPQPDEAPAVSISSPGYLSLLAGLLLLAGCQPAEEPITPVRGKVSYKGLPLQGGTIVFIPDTSRGTHGSIAAAEIQPDGNFTLKTNELLGAMPGHHRVTIASQQVPYLALSAPAWRPALPSRYRDPHLSGLLRQVVPNTPNTINFDLD
jgi:hypothetical protein